MSGVRDKKMQAQGAFHVAALSEEKWEERIQVVLETKGSYPLSDPRKTERLDYAIVVEGIDTVGVDESRRLFFLCASPMVSATRGFSWFHDPTRFGCSSLEAAHLELTKFSKMRRYGLQGATRRWTFLVYENTPAPIVIGLNMVLAWRLCFNSRRSQCCCHAIHRP